MSNIVKRGSWLVYIDGVQCPAISAQVSFGTWQLPQASVSIPADRTMQRIGVDDRTTLTIFALDVHRAPSQGRPPEFVLVFDGEIVSYSYSSSSAGRSINITAVDYMEVLQRMFPYIVRALTDLVRGQTTTDAGVTAVSNPFAPTHALLLNGFRQGNTVRRPFDFVENTIMYLNGDTLPVTDQSEVLRQWFVPWAKRTLFLERLVPSPIIEDKTPEMESAEQPHIFPVLRAAQADAGIAAVAKLAENSPGGSFYAIIEAVFRAMYYEVLMPPCPPYLLVDKETRSPVTATAAAAAAVSAAVSASSGTDAPDGKYEHTIASYITKPQTLFGIPPAFNVVWPSMYEGFSYSENYAIQPTRTYLGNSHIVNIQRAEGNSVIDRVFTVGYPAIANERINAKLSNPDDPTSIYNFLTEEERYKGPVYNNLSTPPWYLFLMQGGSGGEVSGTSLQLRFCRYEHERTRAATRNGGINMPLNLFVVPGMPGLVIDSDESNTHVFGYFSTVTHSFSQDSMTTQVGMTHGATIGEMIDTLVTELNDAEIKEITEDTVTSAPSNPILDIKNVFQTRRQAREYYSRLFYNGAPDGEETIFDFLKAFSVFDEQSKTVTPIDLSPENRMKFTSNSVTGEPLDFRVAGDYRRFMTDPEAATVYASRPFCTLEQYIDSHGVNGVRIDPVSANDPFEGHGAKYYVRILIRTRGQDGTNTVEGVDQDGNPCSVDASDSSRSWFERLYAFRNRVYRSSRIYRG